MRPFVVCFLMMIGTLAYGQGGPPMMTDDPGTPPVGGFELNVARTHFRNRERFETELPLFDLSYGATRNLQLKIEFPLLLARESGVSVQDLGPALIGVKWRFQDESQGKPAVSMFPQIETALNTPSIRSGLAESGLGLLCPFEVQWHRGKLGFNFDAGLFFHPHETPTWQFGGAVSSEVAEGTEVIVELHNEGSFAEHSKESIAQVGLRRTVSPSVTLLAALGRAVSARGVAPTHWTSYVGLQFRF